MLWRRVVFNVLISNTDDHLRNHGFLYEDHRGWRLSPAYDLNPVPVDIRPRVLSTAIDTDDPTASLGLALGRPPSTTRLGLNDARAVAKEVRERGRRSGARSRSPFWALPGSDIDRMASAFEHADLDAARRLRD